MIKNNSATGTVSLRTRMEECFTNADAKGFPKRANGTVRSVNSSSFVSFAFFSLITLPLLHFFLQNLWFLRSCTVYCIWPPTSNAAYVWLFLNTNQIKELDHVELATNILLSDIVLAVEGLWCSKWVAGAEGTGTSQHSTYYLRTYYLDHPNTP